MTIATRLAMCSDIVICPLFSTNGKIAMALISVAPYTFTPNELLTLGIAAYAAVVSTFVLGWDVYKWLTSGAKIDLSASAGMKIFGGPITDSKTYISITAWNVGDQPTTIKLWRYVL